MNGTVRFFLAPLTLIAGNTFAALHIQYSAPLEDRYANLTIFNDGKVTRTLSGDQYEEGTFEKVVPHFLSKDLTYLHFTQIASGKVELPDGSSKNHEVVYCGIINTRSGCLISKETGSFCGGSFTEDGKWRMPFSPDFDLERQAPKVEDYYPKGLSIADHKPLSSLENLMKCDPPSTENLDTYNHLINNNSFTPNDPAFKSLKSLLAW